MMIWPPPKLDRFLFVQIVESFEGCPSTVVIMYVGKHPPLQAIRRELAVGLPVKGHCFPAFPIAGLTRQNDVSPSLTAIRSW